MKTILISAFVVVTATAAFSENQVATLRGKAPLAETYTAPTFPKVDNSDVRQVRNYPEQPPVIPHKIDGYQIDTKFNKCLDCHSRTAIEVSQAPMVSITHFMDRDSQFLASVSPRRYFCTQCHVPQAEGQPLLENTFVDVDQVLDYIKSNEGGGQ
ncbi:Periplasmic nitrate reductase, electron transfer subunit precursor [Roseovarius albus]|uniref:Periplasmic nitrate reductase, electron transfer subunit n=1 Tax=Roseovarius albus TaxID=1247867 RepID=A0A1X6Y7F8_9RHOB|nr:nitrate reductase cytochrome c-type subunit [Roseovarius albus]SLN12621.1 Periplasmic nitrate reductase, electron transfer subunit precursor [Roseovarius albus]